jgi:predicted O-methyltransferase YrrM
MMQLLFRAWRFLRFYASAVTRYQLHSPFVFELVETVLHDNRWYYAYRDVEAVRNRMLQSKVVLPLRDYGTGKNGRSVSLAQMVRRAASTTRQGRQLFRLANWSNPRTMLEIGTAAGIGALYLASGARAALLHTLEGDPTLASVARANLEALGLHQVTVTTGPFKQTLPAALQQLKTLDLVFVDGNHQQAPTLDYFEQCLAFAHNETVFIFDDMHWSADMEAAWKQIQQHPRVTLTIDFFDLSIVCINPDFKEKQHWNVVPSSWKIWKFM